MKLTKQIISKAIQIFLILLLGSIVVALLFFSLTACSISEKLTQCNYNDRIVIGYNKTKTKYKVINFCNNHREPNVNIEPGDTLNVGDYLICKQRIEGRY